MCFLVLAFSSYLFSQNCDQVVVDQANIFKDDGAKVEQAAQSLINKGADVRVRTFVDAGPNIDTYEKNVETNCPSWHDDKGVRKNTLVILAMSMNHKVGVYYGSEWHRAFDDYFTAIKQDSMVPQFRAGNFANGFVLALKQLGNRIELSHQEVTHTNTPVAATVVQQPTDFSGLWTVMKWGLGLFFLVAVIWGIAAYLANKKKAKQVIDDAQQSALDARNQLTRALGKAKQNLVIFASNPNIARAQQCYDAVSDAYAEFSNEIKNDPSQDDFSAYAYALIGESLKQMKDQLDRGMGILFVTSPTINPTPSNTKRSKHPEAKVEPKPEVKVDVEKGPISQAAGVSNVRNDNTIFAPVVIGSSFDDDYERRERERERDRQDEADRQERRDREAREERESRSSSSWSGSSSGSDGGGGGSSDWSSSSSSDSGGGGSSDFGGGGDSGGGGSSSW